MSSVEEKAAGGDDGYAYVDNDLVGGEVPDPETTKPDPDHNASEQLKDEDEEVKKEGAKGAHNNIKSTIVISGVVVAVIGAAFAIARKIKEA